MKILLFIDSLGAGGAQRQMVGLAVMLKQHGHEVKVCYYYDSGFYYEYLERGGVEHELITGAASHAKRIPAVAKYFRMERPDWVIAYQETPSLVACIAKILCGGFKLLVSERNTTVVSGRNEKIRFFFYHWADAIVPNCYSQENFMVSRCPWMKRKLQTISNFVDLELFHPSEKAERDVLLIVVAASVWPPKNVLGFIEAVRILKEKGVKLLVEWYGIDKPNHEADRQYREECERLLANYQLTDMMKLLPKTHSIAEKYQTADFFCLPSFFEGTPNAICEALASGLPVLCSNVSDNSRYVHEGENGFLFDPRKPEEIAEKIGKAMELSGDDIRQYGQRSRKIAEETLSKDSFINKYLELLDSCS